MNRFGRALTVMLASAALSSCGLFGDDEEELEPMELVKIDNKVDIKRLWDAKLGSDSEFLRLGLRPAGDGSRIYAASHDGKVSAFDPESGKRHWQLKLDTELSAGPGVGRDTVVVASKNGRLIALDAATGEERWRTNIDAEALSAPVIKNDVLVVQTIDNRLHGISVFDGKERWTIEQATPALSVRGSSIPVVVGSSAIAGFDNGRMLAVDLDSGDIEWDSLLSPPKGRSDLERLVDIDGAIAAVDQDIYASGYNGRLVAVAAESGQILWAREIPSHTGVSADWNNVYTVRTGGEIVSLTRRDGTESWRDASLLRRELTLPVSFDTTVVVGDLEGYLHFFSNVDGEPVARLRQGSAPITSGPVVIANRLYVQSDNGTLACYEVQRVIQPDRSRDIADAGA